MQILVVEALARATALMQVVSFQCICEPVIRIVETVKLHEGCDEPFF
jgi:hypothetical protein